MTRRDFAIDGNTITFFRLREYRAKSRLHVIMEPVWFMQGDPAELKRLGRRWRDKGKLGRLVTLH